MKVLLIFGAGYSAAHAGATNRRYYEKIFGTTRSEARMSALVSRGIEPLLFNGRVNAELRAAIAAASHLLISIAPDEAGDPVLEACREELRQNSCLDWMCYLSTVGVYGDHHGEWVDENSPCRPRSKRSKSRLKAEADWRKFAREQDLPLAIFRLSGIYGPGRNAFVNIERGRSRRIVKPGQVFNRIHRDDIALAFGLAADRQADGIFNVTDDMPAPPQDVVTLAHELYGSTPPPEIDFDVAAMTPMARSFYGENKRVSNAKSKSELGIRYEWPDYRSALTRMWGEGNWRAE